MKSLTKQQRTFVLQTTQLVIGQSVLVHTESEITAAQWPSCDPIIAAEIKRVFAEQGVVVIEKHSERARAGWSKLTFDAENELDARRAAKWLERARKRIERNNGYVEQAAKVDPVARLAKQIEKLTAAQQRRLFAKFS